jgi:cell division protein FtsN
MARDYKHRAQPRKPKNQQQSIVWWKWLLVILLIALFVYFLNFISGSSSGMKAPQGKDALGTKSRQNKQAQTIASATKKNPAEPRFDFYTILPEKEVVIPDYEIKSRTRQERVGRAKATKYMLQAGSFRNFKDADNLKARLALMGIESNIEVAEIGDTIWNRIKIGPYTKMADVDRVRSRLRENHIDVVVMEFGRQ